MAIKDKNPADILGPWACPPNGRACAKVRLTKKVKYLGYHDSNAPTPAGGKLAAGMRVSGSRSAAPESSTGRWQVQLLGGLQASNGDRTVTDFGGRKAAALFARLVLEPHKLHTRDSLAEWLWSTPRARRGQPVSDPATIQRERLRRVLFRLNTALTITHAFPLDAIIADRWTLRLNADLFFSDVEQFRRHLKLGDRAAALACCRGDLLPGFSDPWIDEQRARLAELRESLLTDTGDDIGDEPDGQPAFPAMYRNTFFDRTSESEDLRRALKRHRLIVVTGIGGCGKTRLCVEVAAGEARFDCRHVVALADCTNASQLFDRIRIALGYSADDAMALPAGSQSETPNPALNLVVRLLRGRRALLLLDNFEQLLGPDAEAAVLSLLQRLPLLHLLVTSRRAFTSSSVWTMPLGPLALPNPQDAIDAAGLSPSVALFMDRARRVRSDFTLHRRNLAGIVALTRMLDGLPLALEMAASRVRKLTPHQIGEALQHRELTLVRSGAGARKQLHHASLKATLDWSWQLLDDDQQRALLALSVFRGGWTLEQAQIVIGDPRAGALIDGLLRDSLIDEERSANGRLRFAMLNSVHDFTTDLLPDDMASDLERRHLRCFVRLSQRLAASGAMPAAADLPNFRFALSSALKLRDEAASLAVVGALEPVWSTTGASSEDLGTLKHLLAVLPEGTDGRSDVALLLVALLIGAGRAKDAQELAKLTLADAVAEDGRRAKALLADAGVRWLALRDSEGAGSSARQALRLARTHGLRLIEAKALNLLGAATLSGPQTVKQSKSHFAAARQLFVQLGDRRGELRALAGHTACLMALAQFRAAIKAAREGEKLAREVSDRAAELQFSTRLSTSFEALGQYGQALDVCQRHVRLAYSHGLSYQLAYGFWNLCMPLARLGRLEDAAQLAAFSSRYWVSRIGELDEADRAGLEEIKRLVVAELGIARFRKLTRLGSEMTESEAIRMGAGNA